MKYVIANEEIGGLYWSNKEGWGNILLADEFTPKEKESSTLPIEGYWLNMRRIEFEVEIADGQIVIYDCDEEVVSWIDSEWIEDPETVVPAIANAIFLAYKKPIELIKKLKRK